MQLADEIRSDIRAAKKMHLPWWGILCAIIGSLPILWLFDHLGKQNLFLPTFNCIGMLSFATALKWKLKQHAWFWFIMAIIVALHVPLILFVPWTTKWVPALAIGAIDSVDLVVILAIVSTVEGFMEGPKSTAR